MTLTRISKDSELAAKVWSKQLASEISLATPIAPLIGSDSNSIIQLKDETLKSAGDKVVFGLRRALKGAGVTEATTLAGNEEQLNLDSQTLTLGELAHAVRIRNEGTIDAQRIPFSLRDEATTAIVDWFSERLSLTVFAHLCGYSLDKMAYRGGNINPTNDIYNGFNQISEPSADRHILPGGASTETELTDKDKHKFDLSLVDKAVECAKLSDPYIRPIRVNGENVYVMYLHPTQVTSLRSNTNPGQWLDIQKAVYSGSRASNPIFDGSLGMYNGVILRESPYITTGIGYDSKDGKAEAVNVRRAVLLGAQAGVIAFGRGNSAERYNITEELFDYNRELGVAAKTIFGFSKTRYKSASNQTNDSDFSTIVVSTYAAPSFK